MSDPDADNPLRERLREKIGQKSGGEAESTDTKEGDYEDDMDDMDDEDDEDDMDSMMETPEEVNEAAQMISEAAGDDVSPEQVVEMLSPLFEQDTADDGQELAGEEIDADEIVTEEQLEEKLEGLVDGLAEEVKAVEQEANVGGTPSPSATGAQSSDVKLFSDGGSGGEN